MVTQASVKMSCFISYYADIGLYAPLDDEAYKRHLPLTIIIQNLYYMPWDYFKHCYSKFATIETLSYYSLLWTKSTGFDQFFL